MSLSIRPVNKHNWRALAKHKVRQDQTHFVASNIYSIAESHYGYDEPDSSGHWELFPYGIYDDGTPVGFFMYGYNFSNRDFEAFIIRLMVDQNHQGQGYGKYGMQQMLEIFRQDERIHSVGISYEPDKTQKLLGERSEQLATSDRGVILLRKLVLNDIESVRRGGWPRALANAQKHDGLVKIDSFTGVRAKRLD